ncbi:helix-turn-helix domain-containing protein [Acidithiobacillus sp. MC6.1]|nr:helix-turn-helix domain-containing protein [Acidithiobacillus sp. MC6.1]
MNALINTIVDHFGSQNLAAQAIGVSQVAVSKWVCGKTRPSALTAIAIERATHGVVTRQELRPDIFGPLDLTEGGPDSQIHDSGMDSA